MIYMSKTYLIITVCMIKKSSLKFKIRKSRFKAKKLNISDKLAQTDTSNTIDNTILYFTILSDFARLVCSYQQYGFKDNVYGILMFSYFNNLSKIT